MVGSKHISAFEYLLSALASVITWACPEPHRRVEALRGRMSEAGRHPGQEHAGAGVEGLFESLLAEAFT
jgi:hypothetical protein